MAKSKNPKVQAVAAGVVASGGALAAGKLVRDRAAERAQRRRTRYRLRPDDGAADGIRRVARGQLELASDRLTHSARKEIGEAIHEARKSLKRLRAVVRLARDPLGDDVYRGENRTYRDAGRGLSDVRDAQVIREALDALTERYRDELPEGAFAGLRASLDAEAAAAHERVRDDGAATDDLVATLDAARHRVATWPLPEDGGWGTLAPGFERIYRRGRRALRAARRDPSTENLHELRKRAKDLWHAAQVLRAADPKRLKRLGRRAHALSDRLGDDHDLAVLLDAARERAVALAPGELALLRALVDRRRARLRRDALACARRVYARKPRAWARRLSRALAHG
ncbi:MAG TPA: CHAD domain-containing protein [Solirubrobacteraceae bacterium]